MHRNPAPANPLTRNVRDLAGEAPVIGHVVSEGPTSVHPEPTGMFRQPYQAAHGVQDHPEPPHQIWAGDHLDAGRQRQQVRFGQSADAPDATSTDWFAACRAAAPASRDDGAADLDAPPGIGEQGRQAARDKWRGYQPSGQPGACVPPPSWGQAGGRQNSGHGGAPDSPFGNARAIQHSTPKDFDVSYKPNPSLKIFTGTVAEYKHWSQRAIDHICRQNHRWRDVLEYTMKYPQPITRVDLLDTNVDGVNAWVLSTKLECWLADWFDKNLYNRRVQLAGGKSETGNGFEVWRQLFRQYSGGTQVVNYGGQMRLKDWPKCTNALQLEAHLDSWMACLEEYGSELYAAPNMLKTMLIGILPQEIENEIMDKPELEGNDYRGIFDWCKKRIEYKRQKALAEFARKSGGNIIAAVIPDAAQSADAKSETVYPIPIDPFAQPVAQDVKDLPSPPPAAATPAPPPGYPSVEQMNELIAALKDQSGRPVRPKPKTKARAQPTTSKVKFNWADDACWHWGKAPTRRLWGVAEDHEGSQWIDSSI